MKDYHFENNPKEFDQTIRLDTINEKVKQMEQNDIHTDDLGDKDAFLNVFQSEHLENIDHAKQQKQTDETEPSDTIQPAVWEQTKLEKNVPNGNIPQQNPKEVPPFWNKKTVGLVTLGCIVALMVCIGLGRLLFHKLHNNDAVVTDVYKPMLIYATLDDGAFLVYDIQQQKQKTVRCTEETEVYHNGERAFVDTIQKGDVLMMALDKKEEVVIEAKYDDTIKQKEITNLSVDTQNRTIKTDQANYVYDANTLFLYAQNNIAPSSLAYCDVLEIDTIADTIWSVEVLQYHGYLAVENKEDIKNGMLQLDDQEPVPLEEVNRIPVSEGEHIVKVTGDNIETHTDNILIEAGAEYRYDLSKAQEKVGVLVINANVTDYKLYINGNVVDSSTPTVLPLGEYDVVILKNGYLEWNQTVTIDKDTVTIKAELQEDVQYADVSIVCNEEGSQVRVDGVEKGVTPLQLHLPYGVYEIEVEQPGFPVYQETVEVKNPIVHIIADLTE